MTRASKGSAFERLLCKTLSLWWTGGRNETVFWRTAGSGARATSRSKKGTKTTNSYGDVMVLDPLGQPFLDVFTLEIKRGYSRSTIADLLDKPKGAATQLYESWIAQAIASQRAAGSLYWLLIVKRDKREPLVFYPIDLWRNSSEVDILAEFYLGNLRNIRDIGCTALTEFLRTLSPAEVKRLARET